MKTASIKKAMISAICVCLCAVFICSCSKSKNIDGSYKTELFGSRGTYPFITSGDYGNLVVDTNSTEYKDYYNGIYINDVISGDLFDELHEGAVQKNDYANIDYVGRLNGVEFDGGSAEGYNLLIGSHNFIDGFEDGLIGVMVGEEVDLNLTFPEEYTSEELAGKDVVFTVKVNYRKTPRSMEQIYADLGYKSLKEYEDDVKDMCINYLATKEYVKTCKFKATPTDKYFKGLVLLIYYDNYLHDSQGSSLDSYIASKGTTVNELAASVADNIADNQLDYFADFKEIKDTVLAYYALLEDEKLMIDQSKLGSTTEYERCLKEYRLIKEVCSKFLREKAKIK